MNKTRIAAVTLPLATLWLTHSWADEHEQEGPGIYPVEAYTCKYNEGKGPADLDKVVADWNQWMDEQDANNYFAMTMTPNYFGGETFDVGWLGSAPTAAELGAGADNWRANGGKLAAAFASVLSCDWRWSWTVKPIRLCPGWSSSVAPSVASPPRYSIITAPSASLPRVPVPHCRPAACPLHRYHFSRAATPSTGRPHRTWKRW